MKPKCNNESLHGENEMSEKIITWIVWRLPKSIIYWSAIRLIAYATQGRYGNTIVSELSAMDALKRWTK